MRMYNIGSELAYLLSDEGVYDLGGWLIFDLMRIYKIWAVEASYI